MSRKDTLVEEEIQDSTVEEENQDNLLVYPPE
jgi:hypothetical protein